MEAREQAFYFMQAVMSVEVPFFQRGYVWDEDNWGELLENLLDDRQSHFLGSIILKQQYVPTGQVPRCYVIDGQQRLTTLSILLRACYDSLPLTSYSQSLQTDVAALLDQILFFKKQSLSDDKEIKIKHSRIDAPDYSKVIRGEMKDKLDEIKNVNEYSSNILQCYKYFVTYLCEYQDDCKKLWNLLTDANRKMLVKIDLDAEENEQAIFDTINSAGVRLTCFDTIKNALFQKANENTKDEKEKQQVIDLYTSSWENIFEGDSEKIEFWNAERQLGRLMRDNREVLLHCVALIKGFYNPEQNKISDLAQIYKEYVKGFDNIQLFLFIREIVEYACIYKKNFITFDKATYFTYSEDVKRLFHILNVCEVSTLHAYLLKLFKDYNIRDGVSYQKAFLDEIKLLEKYVMRHYVCQVSTKNFNKECALLIKGNTSIAKLLQDKDNEINEESVSMHLKKIPSNKVASLILFWIELKRRISDSKIQIKEIKYNYSLEHIMPQKWQEYWGIDVLPVIDIKTQQRIQKQEDAQQARMEAVYQIGNMTLLNSNLNTSIRNYEVKRKIEGEGRKKGIKDYADLNITKEVIENYYRNGKWDEIEIERRTKELTKEFLLLW